MNQQETLKKLYKIFFSTVPNNTLPNKEEIKNTNEIFYAFIEKVKANPEVLGKDDAALNTHLSDYMDAYAFAAFCIGFSLGKKLENETALTNEHLNTIE